MAFLVCWLAQTNERRQMCKYFKFICVQMWASVQNGHNSRNRLWNILNSQKPESIYYYLFFSNDCGNLNYLNACGKLWNITINWIHAIDFLCYEHFYGCSCCCCCWWWEWCCWAQTMESLFVIIIWCGFILAMEKVTIQLQVDGTMTHKTSKPIEMTNIRVYRTTQIHLSHIFNLHMIVFLPLDFFFACFSAFLFGLRAVYLCLSRVFFFITSISYYALFGVRGFFSLFFLVSFHISSSRVSFFGSYTVADYFSIRQLLNDVFMDASMTSSL